MPSTRAARSGFTLVELLVVIMILLMITAASVPILAPAVRNRQQREAARAVSTFISGARSRAIERGRSFGVQVERFDNGTTINAYAMNLRYVEAPPLYAGDFLNSTMFVSSNGRILGFRYGDSSWEGQLREGDLVRLDHSGPWYMLCCGEPYLDLDGSGSHNGLPPNDPDCEPFADLDGNGQYTPSQPGTIRGGYLPGPGPNAINNSGDTTIWTLARIDVDGSGLPITSATDFGRILTPTVSNNCTMGSTTCGEYPFEIQRQPMPSSAPPLQLPEGAVIDLFFSGCAPFDPVTPAVNLSTGTTTRPALTLLFSPSGSLEWVLDGARRARPVSPAYLLIGRPEQAIDVITQTTIEGQNNLQDLSSLWVAVGRETGLVSTTENAGDLNRDGIWSVGECRSYAQSHQQMGGK